MLVKDEGCADKISTRFPVVIQLHKEPLGKGQFYPNGIRIHIIHNPNKMFFWTVAPFTNMV